MRPRLLVRMTDAWRIITGAWPLGDGATAVLAGIMTLLVLGTVTRGIWAVRAPDDMTSRDRLRSLGSWWILFFLFVTILALGPVAVVLAMCVVALLALRETLRLAERMAWYPALAIGAVAVFLMIGRGAEAVLVPGLLAVGVILLLGEWLWRRVRPGRGEGAVRPVVPAALLGTVGPLFAAAVALPSHSGEDADLGWFMLLLVLTALNDSAQAWTGHSIGTHRMTVTLSPNKTWEGLAGGVAATAVGALVIAPWLTPVGRELPLGGTAAGAPWVWCLAFALLIGLGGSAGDLLGSWLKRRADEKDSGHLIPGQGGVLDRIDSLTVTGPLFYLVSRTLWAG